MADVLVGPQPALRPLAQGLAESPGSQLRLGLLAWAGAGTPGLWSSGCHAEAQARIQQFLNVWTLEAWLPGGGPGPDTVIPSCLEAIFGLGC